MFSPLKPASASPVIKPSRAASKAGCSTNCEIPILYSWAPAQLLTKIKKTVKTIKIEKLFFIFIFLFPFLTGSGDNKKTLLVEC